MALQRTGAVGAHRGNARHAQAFLRDPCDALPAFRLIDGAVVQPSLGDRDCSRDLQIVVAGEPVCCAVELRKALQVDAMVGAGVFALGDRPGDGRDGGDGMVHGNDPDDAG